MLAGPIVVVLWVTIGLPMLSQLTGAAGGNRLARKVVFEAQAGAPGGAGGGEAAPATAAAAVVSKRVLAAYHAEVARRERVRARRRAAETKPLAALTLPSPVTPGLAAGSTKLATADLPKAPSPQPAEPVAPPKDSTPPAGNNGSGESNTNPGPGRGGVTPSDPSANGEAGASGPGDSDGGGDGTGGEGGTGATGDTGDPGGTSNAGKNDTGETGDTGGGGAHGNAPTPRPAPGPSAPTPPPPPPAPTPPPPPAPPAPPPPAPPSGPANPGDVQTTNAGGPHGKPTRGDSIVFIFTSAPAPSLILPGWNGLATTVTVLISDTGKSDVLTVLNSSTGTPIGLGSVQLAGDYADRQNVTFAGSTMTSSGSTVTVVLGTPAGKVGNEQRNGTMVWTGPGGTTATESGPADNEF